MKLLYSVTSPFARKCKMTLIVTQLIDETELILTTFETDELRQANPLGKIPALIDGDKTFIDSPFICEYIDHKYTEKGHNSLFKKRTGQYFETQQLHVQADGITNAAVSTVMERRRDTEHSQYWLDRWQKAIQTTIKHADIEKLGHANDIHIGTLAMAASLGYLDFRLSDMNWREWNSGLATWFAEIEKQDWFIQTKPE